MGHRAALYQVQVRKKHSRVDSEARLLGDFDEAGTSLIDGLAVILEDLEAETQDGEKLIRVMDVDVQGDQLRVLVQHGQSGVVADIDGRVPGRHFHQVADDTQRVKCAVFFRLPPARRLGALAVHINNGRGVTGLLKREIREQFRQRFDDATLDIEPVISGDVLDEALQREAIEQIILRKYDRPQDRAGGDVTKWVRANEIGKLELKISPYAKTQQLMGGLIRRFRRDPRVFPEIVEFAGIRFDEARVQVVLPDGSLRTFNIEKPDTGHPITEELARLEFDDDGAPTDESLFAGLRRAARDVTG